jgi:hypothetical protein
VVSRGSTGRRTSGSRRFRPIGADYVTQIYARAGWYTERPEPEQSWRGVLRRRTRPAGPAGRAALAFALELEDRALDVYAANVEPLLTPYVGSEVVAVGKLVSLRDEGFGNELWLASIGSTPRGEP